MVFCSIEGGKQYSSLRSKADVRDVHLELIAVMRGALKQIPGGYFVRHQDGEFKYLVVFAHPEVGGWVVGWLRLTDGEFKYLVVFAHPEVSGNFGAS